MTSTQTPTVQRVASIVVNIHGTEHKLTIREAAQLRQDLSIAVLDTLNGYNRDESEHIKTAVCREFGLSIADLDSDCRAERLVMPRQIAMYLHRKFTRMPLDEIGQCFKRPDGVGRDHGTVRWACESVASMIATDPGLRVVIERLEMALSTKERV